MIRKRIKTTRLIDIFPEFLTAGPFAVLASITGIELPWAEVITAPELDILYIGEHSGEKIVSPLIDKLLEIDEGEITEAHLKAILGAIYNKNALNWSRLWEAVNTEYDPLENYSMLEKHTGTDTKVNTPTNRKETETQTILCERYRQFHNHSWGLFTISIIARNNNHLINYLNNG